MTSMIEAPTATIIKVRFEMSLSSVSTSATISSLENPSEESRKVKLVV